MMAMETPANVNSVPTLAYLADCVVSAETHHAALLESGGGDDLLAAALDRATLKRGKMAAIPARNAAEMLAKVRALVGCVLPRRDGPATIEGDNGLAASVVTDTLTLLGGLA